MSTDIVRRRRISDLEPTQRANVAYECFTKHAKGASYKSLSERFDLTTSAVKVLIAEYGAYLSKNKQYSKEVGLAGYDFILEQASEIIEHPDGQPALVRAKAFEAFIQALTRKDKLLGHESPTVNANLGGETLKDLVNRMYRGNDISPVDSGKVGGEEDIIDAEVVEDIYEDE